MKAEPIHTNPSSIRPLLDEAKQKRAVLDHLLSDLSLTEIEVKNLLIKIIREIHTVKLQPKERGYSDERRWDYLWQETYEYQSFDRVELKERPVYILSVRESQSGEIIVWGKDHKLQDTRDTLDQIGQRELRFILYFIIDNIKID